MALTILQGLILGIIQGITEWLPISSSGMIVLTMTNFFGITDLGFLIREALLLHIGTLLAAIIYFRKDMKELITTFIKYNQSKEEEKKVLNFIILSTAITAALGLLLLHYLGDAQLNLTGRGITLGIAALLFITAGMQIGSRSGHKKINDLTMNDSLLLGGVQGLAGLPGISRSGITVSTLLLRNFDDTTALRLSFLMSIPVVLLGNILLNFSALTLTTANLVGVLAAFILGLATIHGLIKLSRKINFAYFLVVFALLMVISVFL